MWYRIDINKLVLLLLPPPLRKKNMFAWLKVLVYPFSYLVDEFNRYREDANTRLSVNGQVIYMEKALNDYFLLKDKYIYISDIDIDEIPPDVYLYDGEEGDFETYFFDAGSANITYLPDGSQNQSLLFFVNVPIFLKEYEQEIKNIVEFNKSAGRRYEIIYYEY